MKIKKKLYRDSENSMIAGVLAGLANYLDINVLWLRIFWVILSLFYGSGILIYLAAILIIPKEPQNQDEIEIIDTASKKKLHLSQKK